MRTLVLSVCVGLLLSACDGGVNESTDEVEGGEGGAGDAAASADGGRGDEEPGDGEDASNGTPDAGGGSGGEGDSGARDASMRDAGDRDAGRDAATSDAGNGGAVDAGGNPPDAGGANKGRPIFVVAGYRSGIAFSADLGLTWKTVHGPTGPFTDNEYVLSGAAFGEGTFVVAGFDIFTSTDGEHWTERTSSGSEWLGSMNYGNGVFAGAGGTGFSQWSDDGISWHKGTPSLGDEHSDTSAFGNGVFMAASRTGRWWRSTDGKSWTSDSMGHKDRIVWCQDHFANADDCNGLVPTGQVATGENVWIQAQNGTQLRRSTNNGQNWSNVSVGFEANCVAFGYVP